MRKPIRFASITVDPAGVGYGKTTYIGTSKDGWSFVIHEQSGRTMAQVAEDTHRLAETHRVDTVFVDSTGLGAGVLDFLYRGADRDYEVIGVNRAAVKR